MIIDIFGRRVVTRWVADAESAILLAPLVRDAMEKHRMPPDQLTLHADRGAPMTAEATALLPADLGITTSHSRPHTSNDNPFSKSHVKTLKHQPSFRSGSAASRTPGPSADPSSTGTILTTTTADCV